MKLSLIDLEIENDEEYFAARAAVWKYEKRRGNPPDRIYGLDELKDLVSRTTRNIEKVGRQIKETQDI